MLSTEKIKLQIKKSSFSMRDIAEILEISERNLYYKMKNNGLKVSEVNTLIKILNLQIEQIVE